MGREAREKKCQGIEEALNCVLPSHHKMQIKKGGRDVEPEEEEEMQKRRTHQKRKRFIESSSSSQRGGRRKQEATFTTYLCPSKKKCHPPDLQT
jgi:hypothetical protein